jgi:pimeloyl-ACP methyl ester carboxylesterase
MHPSGPALHRAYAQARTGQVHYYDAGGAGAPLVMLHQSPTSAIDFAALFPYLARSGIRVIAMDLPSMGMSDAPPWPPTIEDFADAALAVMDHAGVVTADVFGFHTGVQVGLAAAVKQPERFGKLVLYGAPLMSAAELADWWQRIVPKERDGGAFVAETGGGHLSALFHRLEGVFGLAAAQSMVLSRLMAGPTLWHGHNAALSHDMAPSLRSCSHPILLITHRGEMLDAMTRATHAAKPEAILVDLGVTCALAFFDAPELLARTVVRFLQGHDADLPSGNRASTEASARQSPGR